MVNTPLVIVAGPDNLTEISAIFALYGCTFTGIIAVVNVSGLVFVAPATVETIDSSIALPFAKSCKLISVLAVYPVITTLASTL